MAMSENCKAVLKYLQSVKAVDGGANVTAQDVADALGLSKKTVDPCFTSGIARKEMGFRVPSEIELPDGTHKAVKFLKLNGAGMTFDPDVVDQAE